MGAIWFFPGTTAALRIGGLILWIGLTLGVFICYPPWLPRLVVIFGGILFIWLLLTRAKPQSDRDWVSDQERIVALNFLDSDNVRISNIRDWHHEKDGAIHWIEETYDLTTVQSADYIIEPFANWRGLAHVFISFGFANGNHLAISVEARRKKGLRYEPLRGLYRNYEVIYVVGLERDLIGLRSNVREHPVYVYPLKTNQEGARSLLTTLLKNAAALESTPAFYDTLTNTCTSNIVIHSNKLLERRISLIDWRMIFPGYSDEVGIETGVFDTDLNISEARERFQINDRSAWHDDAREWSAQIRPPKSPQP